MLLSDSENREHRNISEYYFVIRPNTTDIPEIFQVFTSPLKFPVKVDRLSTKKRREKRTETQLAQDLFKTFGFEVVACTLD